MSWRYYVGNGSEPDCTDGQMFCPSCIRARTPGIWNPLPRFDTVWQDHQIGDIQPVGRLLPRRGQRPPPGRHLDRSEPGRERAPARLVTAGQTYVTHLIDSIMRGRDWRSTAIFLCWDDWGGFYDNLKPPIVDRRATGYASPGS